MSKQKYLIWLLCLVVIMLMLLAACGSDNDDSSESAASTTPTLDSTDPPPERGTGEPLNMLFWQAPAIVNPHLSPGTKDLTASRIVYEPLATVGADGNLIPILAVELPSLENGGVAEDGMSVAWTLRDDILWADGEPFTAADVVFTFDYITNPDVGATSTPNYDTVESVEAIDDYTVKINFKDFTPAWDVPFVGVLGQIIPQHLFEDYNGSNAADAPANLEAVGTGPYFVTEFRTEDILIIGEDAVNTIKIIYEPNPHYREAGKPFFSSLELFGGGEDAQLAAQAARDGETDFAYQLAVREDVLDDMESTGNAQAVGYASAFSERIMINFTDPNTETDEGERSAISNPHPFFSDLGVRQAVAMAIDREAIAELYGRTGLPTNNLLVAPPIYASQESVYSYDPEAAMMLLEEAGWVNEDDDGVRERDGVRLSVLFQTSMSPIRQATQDIVKENLEAIGFEVELKQIDASIFFGPGNENTNTRRHFYADLEEFAFSNKVPDPAAYMAAWTCDEAAQMENDWSKSNWSRYCNPEYDALYERAVTEIDPEIRRELFVQMNDLLTEDVAVIPLVQTVRNMGINVNLTGLNLTPWDVDTWNIEDWHWSE